MKKNVLIFLIDILHCIEKIEAYTKGMDKDAFMGDDEAQDAVIRRVEIIGEATKNIPEEFKKIHPNAPWAEMARTRDKLIHGYFDINAERVWYIVKDDLPEAKARLQKLLEALKREQGT